MTQPTRSRGTRYLLLGNSGVGKSTLAHELQLVTGLPILCLDKVFWRPGWVKASSPEMQAVVDEFIATNESWIIDGNYFRRIGDVTARNATEIIWLDPPFWLYFPRLVLRTIRRYLRLQRTCAPGCVEQFKEFYAKDGIIRWCWSNHAKFETLLAPYLEDPRFRRFSGWGYMSALQQWLRRVGESFVDTYRRE